MKQSSIKAFVWTALAVGGALVSGQGCTITSSGGSPDSGIVGGNGGGGGAGNESSGGSAGQAGSGGSGGTTVTGTCSSDLFSYCNYAFAQCEADTDCKALYSCAVACKDGACVTACEGSHAAGMSLYTSLYTCDERFACTTYPTECASVITSAGYDCSKYRGTTTTTDSGTTTGDDGGLGLPVEDSGATPATDPCETCKSANCASENTACAAGTDCEAFANCVGAGTDPASCASMHQSGAQASAALGTCITSKCNTECQ